MEKGKWEQKRRSFSTGDGGREAKSALSMRTGGWRGGAEGRTCPGKIGLERNAPERKGIDNWGGGKSYSLRKEGKGRFLNTSTWAEKIKKV